jgi:NAD(P)H-hydrate repair Nnr-like enzyme with NAD(P)H-hydrate dehydratase domain
MKIVINKTNNQFQLSGPAEAMYYSLSGKNFNNLAIERDSPELVQVVETMGTTANGLGSELAVIEVAEGYQVVIDADGFEQVEQATPKATKNVQTPQANQETL